MKSLMRNLMPDKEEMFIEDAAQEAYVSLIRRGVDVSSPSFNNTVRLFNEKPYLLKRTADFIENSFGTQAAITKYAILRIYDYVTTGKSLDSGSVYPRRLTDRND